MYCFRLVVSRVDCFTRPLSLNDHGTIRTFGFQRKKHNRTQPATHKLQMCGCTTATARPYSRLYIHTYTATTNPHTSDASNAAASSTFPPLFNNACDACSRVNPIASSCRTRSSSFARLVDVLTCPGAVAPTPKLRALPTQQQHTHHTTWAYDGEQATHTHTHTLLLRPTVLVSVVALSPQALYQWMQKVTTGFR